MKKENLNYKRTKLACYSAYFTMSSIFCVPPLLFVTFHETYGISYSLLGTLVLVNFCTQLFVDLLFTFFSKRLNAKIMCRVTPIITSAGLLLYAIIPIAFPSFAYIGLLIGTFVFSIASGLAEVLLSPVIAALPSDNPQRDMSTLHSLYAFGFLTMVVVSTLFLRFFGESNWWLLVMILAVLPLIPAFLFMTSPIPDMGGEESSKGKRGVGEYAKFLALCVGCIFFGSCAENAMSNWISGYMENALGIDKAIGDILGMAVFAVLLGLGRILYAKFGKNIVKTLLVGMIGAAVCYLFAGLSLNVALSFCACILTGLFTSMLWPGTLIMMEENLPGAGVAAFALMASGGDLGASVAPQLMGIIIDGVAANPAAAELGSVIGLTSEQVGLKAGMLVCSIFPIIGIALLLFVFRYFRKKKVRS